MQQPQRMVVTSRYNISQHVCDTVNRIAGTLFSEDDLQIEFGKIAYCHRLNEHSLLLSLSYSGIEAELYVGKPEINRLMGVTMDFFEEEYIEYLVVSNFGQFGVGYRGFVKPSRELKSETMVNCLIRKEGFFARAMIRVDSLDVAEDSLYQKGRYRMSQKLLLPVQLAPFETTIDVSEAVNLSVKDIVYVYER